MFMAVLLFSSCSEEKKELTANEIIDKAIQNAGGNRYENAEIEFIFRKKEYKSKRQAGKFQLERVGLDSVGNRVRDILTNDGLERQINDTTTKLQDSLILPVGNSINSVHYFVHLPYGLNAPAANKKLIGKDSIAGREYYEIKVQFAEEGGGTDHEDEYLYWIDTQNFEVDYLAYNFDVNGGGIRFRKAFNHRIIEGIRFVDYENYKYEELSTPLHKLDSLYEKRELDLLSLIETKDVKVKQGS